MTEYDKSIVLYVACWTILALLLSWWSHQNLTQRGQLFVGFVTVVMVYVMLVP